MSTSIVRTTDFGVTRYISYEVQHGDAAAQVTVDMTLKKSEVLGN